MRGWCARRTTTRGLRPLTLPFSNALLRKVLRSVRDGSFLAVAATDEYAAVRAAERLAVAASWDSGDGLSSGDIYESLRTNERASLPVVDGTPVEASVPPLDAPPVGAAATLEARYERPYQMHGSLGPSAAMAEFADGRLTVHTHSQGIYFLRAALADAFDMDPEAVRVVHAPGSGCYGHNAPTMRPSTRPSFPARSRRTGHAQMDARG